MTSALAFVIELPAKRGGLKGGYRPMPSLTVLSTRALHFSFLHLPESKSPHLLNEQEIAYFEVRLIIMCGSLVRVRENDHICRGNGDTGQAEMPVLGLGGKRGFLRIVSRRRSLCFLVRRVSSLRIVGTEI